jgi:hypothetical protein
MSININILSNFNGTGFDKLTRELDRLNTPMEKIGAVSRTLAPAAIIGLTALSGMAVGAVRAAEEAQIANNRLDSVADSMGLFGTNTKTVTDRLKAFADETSKKIAVDDELILSTQAQLMSFKDLAITAGTTGGAFDRATVAAFDMAAVFGGTGEDNAIKLGKALGNPVEGVTALTRVGILFTEEQKKMIETLVASGDVLGAQELILKEVETQSGGAAEATATDSAKMSIAFGEMAEAIGTGLLPILEFVTPLIIDFFDYIAANSGVITVLAGIFGALAVAILLVNFALNANPIVKVITLIAFLVAGVVLLIDWLVGLYGGWDKLFEDLGKWIKGFSIAFEKALFEIGQFFGELFGAIGAIAKGALNGILGFVEGYINFIISGINGLIDLINTVLGAGKAIGINLQIGKIPTVTIPRLAEGGIVMPRPGGVLANIAEGGQAEAVIPLNRLGDFTGKAGNTYNITVNGGVGSGATIGKSIVDAIKAYERSSGAVWQGA